MARRRYLVERYGGEERAMPFLAADTVLNALYVQADHFATLLQPKPLSGSPGFKELSPAAYAAAKQAQPPHVLKMRMSG